MGRWFYILGGLVLAVAVSWGGVAAAPDKDLLHIVACDVGQGDGILIFTGTNQILVDGGPGNLVLDCLGKYMPFWDRQLELVINTHPQKDHYQGLIEVFKRYEVDKFLVSGLDSSNQGWRVLQETVGGKGVETITASCGQKLRLGLIYLDIVNPCSLDNIGDPNEASVIFYLKFEDFDALFTGDIYTRDLPLSLAHKIDYLKVPHHGSKNGLSDDWLVATAPRVAVISVGKNSYGHPSEEIMKILGERDIKVLRTDEEGDIEIISDGKSWWVR
ncbi:hypothetical protein A3F62_03245 [Candidatus Woesebacteria bacterium RIFCSPHIGHO2_12_FULL_44_11]|uniref:Metallo-beta-lactamase domain-containing protein n=1 Tax=Candidatus Woesebacteria bacterium RIFCSPLOWO2_01_FULL_44_14 TaxID=1802525 RepID=A0A1F8C3G6_9BACT|nr:MAG: hypothetical protein A3F62_03245 [Candidatus Woesebacteria bacterium RIFCSPHIGHO2_12_FULL_44_11]OGM70419.1 MAG: hypothetical protein A2975_01810 [Candidatus Woesebacteria bacterium RIFCSPLOWO2_01_FULL_44_14]